MLPLLLIAASVGLSNLAAAIGIGFGGVTVRTRLRVAVVFGAFEAGMPIVGLVIGAGLATGIGELARWIGAALLIALGCSTVLRALRQPRTLAPGKPGRYSPGTMAHFSNESHPGNHPHAGEAAHSAHDHSAGVVPARGSAGLGKLILSGCPPRTEAQHLPQCGSTWR